MAKTLAMFTDTSLCIGCRACQVACKQWNELGAEMPEWTGSYQNHHHFTDKTFRLVRFMPIRTVPLPIGITSPPSIEALAN